MRRPTDLDCPTIIRRALDDEDVDLTTRCRFTVLWVEYAERAASGELVWR